MKTAIRSELYKAVHNRMLYIAIAAGLAICVGDVIENILNMQYFNEQMEWMLTTQYRTRTAHTGYSLFYLWMGISSPTSSGSLFHLIWPVLAAMAYGWSYNEERRSGLYNQIAARTSPRVYYIAKYIGVFVSGGLAISTPLLVDLLINALVVPYDIPFVGTIPNGYFMSGLFYSSPWSYGLIWCGMVFLMGGAAACFCFVVGTKLRHSVMIVLVPYALYVCIDATLNGFLPTLMQKLNPMISPLWLTMARTNFPNPAWFLLLFLATQTAISFSIGYWQVVKHELV